MSSTPKATAVTVTKLSYIGFETPDVQRLRDYYTNALQFEDVDSSDRYAYLTTGSDHHCVVLTQSEQAVGRSIVGFEIAEDLDHAQRQLVAAGYEVSRRTDIGPGTTDVLVLEEPETGVPLHLISEQTSSGGVTHPPLRPTKLGHVASYAPSVSTMLDFYKDLLGFRWSDSVGDFFVFMRCNADHHAVNFMASDRFRGMHHAAYEMRDPAHLITMLDHLSSQGHRLMWGPGRHGPGHNMFTYHRDPDGNVIELFTQLDLMLDEHKATWEPRPWHEEHPMGPRIWDGVRRTGGNLWGPRNEELLAR